MSSRSRSRWVVERVARWAARILASALLLLFVVFMIGEGLPPVGWQSAALLAVLVGFVLAWFHDLVAGTVILLGALGFYAINLAESGKLPGGWVFPLLFVPGLLLIASALLKPRSGP